MEYINVLKDAIVWTITIFWLYQLIVSACSLIKLKDKKLIVDKKHKFMAIIPAHNEENVVTNLIESLKKQNYPSDLLDIYVIADNCSDNTAKVAKEAGAIVYQRFDEAKKTKGFALNWFLEKMKEEKKEYDALFVFDADNIVDKEFTASMNKKLCQGEEVVQGYRDIKNPTDSWVSSGYAIFYWTMHRFYHLARYNLGMSPLLNGTGFMVKYDLIIDEGWNTKTLTEDIEFSLMRIISGKRIGWSTEAIVFDEQPVDLKTSIKQRSRWSVGHIQCFKLYTKDLARAVKEHKSLMNVDGFLYILGMPILVITLLLVVLNVVIYGLNGMTGVELWFNIGKYLGATFLLPSVTAIFILYLEKKPIKPMIKGLLCYPLFMGSWIYINLKCLIKPDTSWEKIKHTRDIKINEVI